jgi:tagatose 1,6-diphosphate aldolase
MRRYGNDIGYGVRPAVRGRRFAARAVRLIVPLAVRHGFSELWIACDPDNIASRRTCEAAGAEFEIVDLPPEIDVYREGARQKCMYRLTLPSMSGS